MKRKHKDSNFGTKVKLSDNYAGTRKSTRFLGKPRVVYTKKNSDFGEDNNDSQAQKNIHSQKTIKAPYAYSTPMTCDRVLFRGIYYQIGDIVGLKDITDDQMYYAQIRGFLEDQYSEKSAVITWLLPSSSSPDVGFDASTYFLGPEEDLPRKLEYMEFICHAPSDYYRNPYSPYPTKTMKPETGFIWTRLNYGVAYKIEDCKKICSKPRFTDPLANQTSNKTHENEFNIDELIAFPNESEQVESVDNQEAKTIERMESKTDTIEAENVAEIEKVANIEKVASIEKVVKN